MITIKSEILKHIPNLDIFLEDKISHQEEENTSCLAVWGNEHIPPEENEKSIPLLRLKESIYSLYGDESSIYGLNFAYENNLYYFLKNNIVDFLESDWEISQEDLDITKKSIQMINKYCISKYNQFPVFQPINMNDSSNNSILLIDQTVNSLSVLENDANINNFTNMFMYAFENFPNSKIYIKYHPDTISGVEEGYLQKILKKNKLLEHPSIEIIDYNCNVASIFYYVSDILTVTSPVGFEALLRGKNVITFGNSFYSGCGLTTDLSTVIKKNRTIEEIFNVLFIKNSIYINPFTNQKGSILDVLEYISLQKRHKNNKHVVFFRTEFSKSKNICNLLNLETKEHIYLNNQSKIVLQDENKLFLVDNEKYVSQLSKKHKKAFIGEGIIFPIENPKNQPTSMIVDFTCSLYNDKVNSDLDEILNNEEFTDYEIQNINACIEKLKLKFQKELEIFSNGYLSSIHKEDKKVIFVPGNNDHNLKLLQSEIKNDLDLIINIAEREKNAIIIYKPASDSKVKKNKDLFMLSNNKLQELCYSNQNQIYVETNAHVSHLINFADEVHILTHNYGIETLIQGKKLINYGNNLFSGRGLSVDLFHTEKDSKPVSLEKMILCAVMLYPRYKIPHNKHYVSANIALDYYMENIENVILEDTGFFSKLFKFFKKEKNI